MKLRRILAVLVLAGTVALGAALPAQATSDARSSSPVHIATGESSAPAPVSAVSDPLAPMGPASPAARGQRIGVDDFEFARMDVEYELGRDAEGRSTLRTVEHLVALFPEVDQNRGIRRAIPRLYDGHSTDITILSVTDEDGVRRDFVTATDGDFLLLTIAYPVGQYVHGEQHYVIEYTQRDVTKFFENTNDDEFYWDVNGTGWAQPFGEVTAAVHLEDDLANLVTETACYRGYEGSTQQCPTDFSGGVLRVAESDLWSFQNVTIVAAFPAGTFTEAPFSIFDVAPALGLFGIGAALLAGIVGVLSRIFVLRDAKGRGVVIAQYEPPPGMTLPLAAEIVGKPNKAFAATLIDFAVRGKLRIVERDGFWSRKEFGLQRLPSDDSDLQPTEQRLLAALFLATSGVSPNLLSMFGVVQPQGDVRWLTKNDAFLGQHVRATRKEMAQLAVTSGLRRRGPKWPIVVVTILFALAFLLLILLTITNESEQAIAFSVIGLNAVPWLAVGIYALVGSKRPLTESGALMKEYLDGLKEFIGWAEADRLRMLQSVTGAERGALGNTDDPARVVKLYERLLPYAVLFGQEKEWSSTLSRYYGEQSPGWYSGSSGFHAAAFAAGISSFSSSTSSSYSGSSSSSSSGGSGGGGSSGGGGGGGGGGGV